MTPSVRALVAEMGDPDVAEFLERLGKERGPDLLAARWFDVAEAVRAAVAQDLWFLKRVWPLVQRSISFGWFACLALAMGIAPTVASGWWPGRMAAAAAIYVGWSAAAMWIALRRGAHDGLGTLHRRLVAAAVPMFALGLAPVTAPWAAPAAVGIAGFLAVFVAATALPRVALVRRRRRTPQAWAAWYLLQALTEAGSRESAGRVDVVRMLDRTALILERSMHCASGPWSPERVRKLRTAFCGLAAGFRAYGDELAWRWPSDVNDCLAEATVAAAAGDWSRLRPGPPPPSSSGWGRRTAEVAKRVGVAAVPLAVVGLLWVLPVGVEAAVLTSLTVSALVWSVNYLAAALSPELGAELGSMGEELFPVLM